MISQVVKAALGYGHVRSQALFERLHRFAVRGMNFGMAHFETSGELEAIRYIHRKIGHETAPVIFDVGANLGEYSLALYKVFGPSATIHAFEPLPSTYQILTDHVSGNNSIVCHNFGFGEKEDQVTLFHGGAGSTIASVYSQRPDHPWRTDEQESIHIRTVDEFCAEVSIPRIDFLKIDIEGHEFRALEGARAMLAADAVRYIQFEFGPRQIDSRTYFRDFYYLLRDKYQVHRVVRNGLFPVSEYTEYHELFGATANYIAEHKEYR